MDNDVPDSRHREPAVLRSDGLLTKVGVTRGQLLLRKYWITANAVLLAGGMR
jgi:hypothetical protein